MTPALVTERNQEYIGVTERQREIRNTLALGARHGTDDGDTETSGEWCLDRVISHLLYISHTLDYAIL